MGGASGIFNRFGGPILLGFGVIAVVAALGFLFDQLKEMSKPVIGASLPLLAIGGIILLVLMLTAVAMIFSILGLANKDQAMGLPEGSIRAVIALSLIVLFAILSVFLFKSILENGPTYTVENISEAERAQFIRDHTTARNVQSFLIKDKNDQPFKNPDGTPKNTYNLTYSSSNPASDDFAKQLLVLLGTLMTAVTSFYLGAGTATSAAAAVGQAGQASQAAKPTVSGITPTKFAIVDKKLHLDIAGAGLNVCTNVRITKGSVQIAATGVSSNANHVICDIDVSTATPGAWDVVVDDGGARSASLPHALELS